MALLAVLGVVGAVYAGLVIASIILRWLGFAPTRHSSRSHVVVHSQQDSAPLQLAHAIIFLAGAPSLLLRTLRRDGGIDTDDKNEKSKHAAARRVGVVASSSVPRCFRPTRRMAMHLLTGALLIFGLAILSTISVSDDDALSLRDPDSRESGRTFHVSFDLDRKRGDRPAGQDDATIDSNPPAEDADSFKRPPGKFRNVDETADASEIPLNPAPANEPPVRIPRIKSDTQPASIRTNTSLPFAWSFPWAANNRGGQGVNHHGASASTPVVVPESERKISIISWCRNGTTLEPPETLSSAHEGDGTEFANPVESWLKFPIVQQIIIVSTLVSNGTETFEHLKVAETVAKWQQKDDRIKRLDVRLPDSTAGGFSLFPDTGHSLVLNAAASLVPDSHEILKISCDTVLTSNFFAAHPLILGSFYHGSVWVHGLDRREADSFGVEGSPGEGPDSNEADASGDGSAHNIVDAHVLGPAGAEDTADAHDLGSEASESAASIIHGGSDTPCTREVILLTKELFEAVNGFDERIRTQGGWETPDLIRRVAVAANAVPNLIHSRNVVCTQAEHPNQEPAAGSSWSSGGGHPSPVPVHTGQDAESKFIDGDGELMIKLGAAAHLKTHLYRLSSSILSDPWGKGHTRSTPKPALPKGGAGISNLSISLTSPSVDLFELLSQSDKDLVTRYAARSVLIALGAPGDALSLMTDTAYMTRTIPSYQRGRQLVIHLQFGLCNRLRALASAMDAAKRSRRHLRVIWEQDMHAASTFEDLFESNHMDVYTKSNDHEYAPSRYDRYNYMETEAGAKKYELIRLESPKHIYVKSAFVLNYTTTSSSTSAVRTHVPIRNLLRTQLNTLIPVKPVRDLLADFEKEDNLIGVHIREADPRTELPGLGEDAYALSAWKKLSYFRGLSNYENFASEIKLRLALEPLAKFFISADNPQIKTNLRLAFGAERILAIDPGEDGECVDRGAKCLQYALADLLMLGKTKELYGSYWSSFTEVAAYLNGENFFFFFPQSVSAHTTVRLFSLQ
jgi:hypothetical protein